MDVTIFYNPDRGTSCNPLALIRNAGVERHIIEYLKSTPSRTMLVELLARIGISTALRWREDVACRRLNAI